MSASISKGHQYEPWVLPLLSMSLLVDGKWSSRLELVQVFVE